MTDYITLSATCKVHLALLTDTGDDRLHRTWNDVKGTSSIIYMQ